MSRALIYAPEALADLDAATAWLTQPGSGPAAWRRLDAIWAAIERLREYPCLYPVMDHPGVRELPCPGGWRAFYKVEPDTGSNATAGDVVVLRVHGPGQDRRGFGAGPGCPPPEAIPLARPCGQDASPGPVELRVGAEPVCIRTRRPAPVFLHHAGAAAGRLASVRPPP